MFNPLCPTKPQRAPGFRGSNPSTLVGGPLQEDDIFFIYLLGGVGGVQGLLHINVFTNGFRFYYICENYSLAILK